MTSGSVAGAETMTFEAPPFSMCWMTSGRLVYLPVDSMTTVDAQVLPGELADLFLGQDADLPAVDDDGVLGRLDVLLERAQDRVVLEQMGQRLGVGDIVDGHVFDGRVVPGRPEHVAADPAEPVDTYADSHGNLHCFAREE